ncbi:DHHC zinc finger domain-containing protein [Phanerochaete sordida]|uniref:Palmitoyltransferase n=1 Tax=Phanerochaete sordida TaxID=48140 RepID=A0A9P3G5Z3_9APHY|nr:DHHC zinc finger domain-containing protein [Phanerochaete sordida]
MSRDRPLLDFGPVPSIPPPSYAAAHDDEEEKDAPPRRWYHFLPTCVTVLFLLAPQPSWLILLTRYHLGILHDSWRFTQHLCVSYALTLLAFSSLITIITRDPGRPSQQKENAEAEDMNLTQALLADDFDYSYPGRWCRKCWAPKPERAHHCSHCGRCVLKMDHHCMWLGYKCLGHRNYTSFLHFITCISLLSLYIACVSVSATYYAFTNPLNIDDATPLHAMSLGMAGIILTMVLGPFAIYHAFLVSTNQTTLEHLSPFQLLRKLPPLPQQHASNQHRLSDPPLEHELSFSQRRLIRDAHGYIKVYDLGWRKNWAQVLGYDKPYGWVGRVCYGGGGVGDGITFPRNPKADELLARLASELVDVDKIS